MLPILDLIKTIDFNNIDNEKNLYDIISNISITERLDIVQTKLLIEESIKKWYKSRMN